MEDKEMNNKNKEQNTIIDIRKLAEDIIKIKFKKTDTLKDCLDEFYEIMRKYGIKEGMPSYNEEGKKVGRLVNNYEWTICKEMFINRVIEFFNWETLFSDAPKDLLE